MIVSEPVNFAGKRMEIEKLRQDQEYGESVLQVLDAVKQPLPDWVPADLNNSLQSLRQAANKTVELASSPVKIGVMGEFSSGKTLLLGSAIGYADTLPVSERPTTGNITAVHLVQQEELQTTNVDPKKGFQGLAPWGDFPC